MPGWWKRKGASMINPTPYDAPTTTAYKPQPAAQPKPTAIPPGERIIAAEMQAQERNVSRLLKEEEFFRSAMINTQVNRMSAEAHIKNLAIELAVLRARRQ